MWIFLVLDYGHGYCCWASSIFLLQNLAMRASLIISLSNNYRRWPTSADSFSVCEKKSFCKRGKWFTNRASQAHSSSYRWSNITMLNVSNMGFGDHMLCSSGICESVLWLPSKCTLRIIGLGSDCSTTNRKAYRSNFTEQIYSYSRNKMVIFNESRAFQLKRTCSDHHICKFWIKSGGCGGYYHHCEGILSWSYRCSTSYVVNADDSGEPLLNSIAIFFLRWK